ncbi:MAG: MFS transporter [Microbacteriaceae bacterium]|nr:MFS transporter [Microbacteriaceae bacterium]
MSETPPGRRRALVDLTPLRASPAFARLYAGTAVSGIGAQLTIVAVGLQVYDITRSTLAVSLVGGIALVPLIVAGLWGGMLADSFDRRTVAIVSAIVGWGSTLGLVVMAIVDLGLGDRVPVWPLYVLTTVNAVAATIGFTTRGSIYPRLLPPELLPGASAMNGMAFGLQLTVGPALAGVLVATVGFAWTYAVDAVLFLAAFAGLFTLPRLPAAHDAVRPGLRSLREGLAYLRRAPNIRAGFLVDLFAMTFGRPHVLFPAVGALVIGGGAITVGVLTAAGAVGTFLTGLFSGQVGHVRWQGRAIASSVVVYGAFVALFGVVVLVMQTGWFGDVGEDFSRVNAVALVLAALAMAGTGASDEVSAIFRSTMLMVAAPDGMRGRMQGIFTVVVTGGPRVGDLYVGALATAVALWFPPVLGGLVIVVAVGIIGRIRGGLRDYDALNPAP